MTTIGIIGAGLIGSNLARVAVTLGYDVVIGNSRGPETLAGLVTELGPRARAATAPEAAAAADFAIVAVPFKNYRTLPAAELAGKIVIDTSNYDPDRDGRIDALETGGGTNTVTGLVQAHLARSRVVKGFNLIGWDDITTAGRPAGAADRRALATASDFADAIAFITGFFNEFGFDTVSTGDLSTSWRFDREQPAYVIAPQSAAELTANLAAASENSGW